MTFQTIFSKIRSTVLSGLLAGSTLFSSVFGIGVPTALTNRLSDETYFAHFFRPTTRFVVASDVHIVGSGIEEARLAELFDTAYAYAKSQVSYKKLDGVFFAGDCANTGDTALIERFFEIAESKVKAGTVMRAVPGNHEFYFSGSTVSDFMAAGGYDSLNVDLKINGYHFILVYPDVSGNDFSANTLAWLEKTISDAEKDDPKHTKPIFVFQHQHPRGTVYGSNNWGVDSLTEVFAKHPQVVDFSGHSHFPISDPRAIWQGSFTALGDGTLSYYEVDMVNYAEDNIFPTDQAGGYATTYKGTHDAAQYYIVEVDRNNAVCIKGYDLLSDTFIAEYHLRSVADVNQFTYTNARADACDTPAFAANAQLQAESVGCQKVTLCIPQAEGGDTPVQSYRLELFKGSQLVQTAYCLSDYFFVPMPTALRKTFTGLSAQTAYTVKCYAVNCWGKESAPLTFCFQTGAGHSDIQPPASAVTPDIFSLRMYEDGCVYDTVSKKALVTDGADPKVTSENNVLNLHFDGSGTVKYTDFADSYAALADGLSMEFCGSVQYPKSTFADIFANMENGGVGFELTTDGTMQFWVSVDGTYHFAACEVPENTVFHCVGKFDGQEISIWLNGVKKDTVAVSGKVTFTTAENAKMLYIGGDSSQSGSYEYPCTATVRAANIYSGGLTEKQIQDLSAGWMQPATKLSLLPATQAKQIRRFIS